MHTAQQLQITGNNYN